MARKRPVELEPLELDSWERSVLHACAQIQVERHWRKNESADRWRTIANAISAGRPIKFVVTTEPEE